MTWWKKHLAKTTSDTDSQKALTESREALTRVESLRPQIEQVSSSLANENATNHFVRRVAIAYGLPGEHHD